MNESLKGLAVPGVQRRPKSANLDSDTHLGYQQLTVIIRKRSLKVIISKGLETRKELTLGATKLALD